MKGQTSEYPYTSLEGLNPFQEELKSNAKTLEYQATQIGLLAKLSSYFAGFSEVTNDDVGSIYVGPNSVTFSLAVKDSKFVHALAQFTGLKFEKRMSWDGKSLTLDANIPDKHTLHELGFVQVSVAGYLPESCKIVIKEHTPLSDEQKAMYQKFIDEGTPVFETKCDSDKQDEIDHVNEELSNVLGG